MASDESDPRLLLETERLRLRRFVPEDDGFVLALLNEPSFLRFIGDRGVRTLADARRYVEVGALADYRSFGYGMYVVTLRAGGAPIGICGLVRRTWLAAPDLGFALLAEHEGRGYGRESATAVLGHARRDLGLERLLAVTTPDNGASIRLLGKLGFAPAGKVCPPGEDEPLELFALELGTAASGG